MFSIEQEISSYLLSEKLFSITQRDGVGSVQLHEITTFKKENFVADELPAAGIPLFYWKGKDSAEMDFIVKSDNKLYPIDVK